MRPGAIEQRFRDLFGGEFPTAEQILTTDVETLRGPRFFLRQKAVTCSTWRNM